MCRTRRTVAGVAQNLGVNKDLLYRWRREYHNGQGKYAFPGHGREALTAEQQRIRDLEKRLKEIEMERDILKKAKAIFSRASK